ncbi:hypothetical protein V8F20_007999 [Naviculisporaceae sp. PSN 640]
MSSKQSAQSPTAEPHPTKEDSYNDPENVVSKNPPEEACSDTPLSNDPYDSNGEGGGYFPAPGSSPGQGQGQSHRGPASSSPRPASPAFFIPHSVMDGQKKSGGGSGSSPGHGHISPSHSPAPGAPERGVRAGTGVQYSGGQLQRKESSHPLRQALGVDQVNDDEDNQDDRIASGEKGSEQDQVKMAPPSEGKVARSVEGTREQAREEQAHAPGAHVATQERGVKYQDLGLGEEHGHGHGEGQEHVETEGRESGQRRRKSSAGQRHGRIRGEVSLGEDEAELERKKAQQSWDREQIQQARREGKDVDGGSFGARPHAEVD